MLVNGRFVKEPPIKIGAHYVPLPYKPVSQDELIVQHLILDCNKRHREPIVSSLVVVFLIVGICVMMING